MTKLNKPLIPIIIMGGIYNMEQIEKHLKRRLLRPLLSLKLEHLHVSLKTRLNLRGTDLKYFNMETSNLDRGNRRPILVNKHS